MGELPLPQVSKGMFKLCQGNVIFQDASSYDEHAKKLNGILAVTSRGFQTRNRATINMLQEKFGQLVVEVETFAIETFKSSADQAAGQVLEALGEGDHCGNAPPLFTKQAFEVAWAGAGAIQEFPLGYLRRLRKDMLGTSDVDLNEKEKVWEAHRVK